MRDEHVPVGSSRMSVTNPPGVVKARRLTAALRLLTTACGGRSPAATPSRHDARRVEKRRGIARAVRRGFAPLKPPGSRGTGSAGARRVPQETRDETPGFVPGGEL